MEPPPEGEAGAPASASAQRTDIPPGIRQISTRRWTMATIIFSQDRIIISRKQQAIINFQTKIIILIILYFNLYYSIYYNFSLSWGFTRPATSIIFLDKDNFFLLN
jgi:hypothetical protein